MTERFSPGQLYNCWTGGQEPSAEELEASNGLEIQSVCEVETIDGTTVMEPCDRDEATVWSVYLHQKEGGVLCLTDCPTRELAQEIAAYLGNRWGFSVYDFS